MNQKFAIKDKVTIKRITKDNKEKINNDSIKNEDEKKESK